MTEQALEAGVYYVDVNELVNINSGKKSPRTPIAPPVVPPDGFTLGTTQPTEANTGAAGTLTVVNGDYTHTSTSPPLRDLDIRGRLLVRSAVGTALADGASNNVIVRGPAIAPTASTAAVHVFSTAAGFDLSRISVIPQAPSLHLDAYRVEAAGRFFRCNFRDTVDGFRVLADDVKIHGCYGDRFFYATPDPTHLSDDQTHNDWCQAEKGLRLEIDGCACVGRYGTAGTHSPANQGGPTPSGWPNPSFAWVLLSANVGPIGQLVVRRNWVYGFDIPMNTGSTSVSGINLGAWTENLFDRTSRSSGGVLGGWTLAKRADQTCDFGVGTTRRNLYMDGGDVTIRSAG